MSNLYKVRILDSNRDVIAVLVDSFGHKFENRFNQARELSFQIPVNSDNLALLEIAAAFEIWRDDEVKAAGRVIQRDLSSNPAMIVGLTNECYLDQVQTPGGVQIDGSESVLGASGRLADIVDYLTYDYRTDVYNRSLDVKYEPSITDVADFNFDLEDMVGLARDSNEVYPIIEEDDSAGRIGFEFDEIDGYTFHCVRWGQRVGDTNEILFRYRSSTDDGTSWSAWSAWQGQGAVSDYPETNGFLLTPPAGATNTQVQFQLTNEDNKTETQARDDDDNEVTYYGSTPILEAVEMVYRQDEADRLIEPHSTDWPTSADTPEVFNASFNYERGLKAIIAVVEQYGYEFYVDHELKLHLAEEFGDDLTGQVLFVKTRNMNIARLEDDDRDLINSLTCLGAGEGRDQLIVYLRDQDSIDAYGVRPGTIENKDLDTLTLLEEEGQEFLDERKDPIQRFQVAGILQEDFPTFGIGDKVSIAIPDRGILTDGRILYESRDVKSGEAGEEVALGINDFLESIVDRITQETERIPPSQKPEAIKPNPPTNLTAQGDYRRVTLSWQARGWSRLFHSTDLHGVYRVLYQSGVVDGVARFAHEGLDSGSTHYYKATQIVDRVESDAAGPVSAVASTPDATLAPAVENLALSEVSISLADGTKVPGIDCQWDIPVDVRWARANIYRRRIKEESLGSWLLVGSTTDSQAQIWPVAAGTYEVMIVSVNAEGGEAEWDDSPVEEITIVGTVDFDIIAKWAEIRWSANAIHLNWEPILSLDLLEYAVRKTPYFD